jgi:hypothetical protein
LHFAKKRFSFWELINMNKKIYDKEACIALLRAKYSQLVISEQNRYPKRSDFSDTEVTAIKACLGPWPRALEAAGIKPVNCSENRNQNKSN